MDRASRKVAIVVLNYNGIDDTVRCLVSLKAIPEPVRVILVDNASDVNPQGACTRVYPDLDFIRTPTNLGYAGGNNRGIARALEWGADYVLVINNDTVVDPSIVRALAAVFDENPSLAVIGPVVNFMDEPGTVMTDGVAFNPGPGTEFFRRIAVPTAQDPPALVPVDIVNGCCMMLTRKMLRTVGAFDETFFIVHEESDLCLRARRAGFGCAVLGRTLVWHKGSSAFDRAGRQLQRYFDARNLFYLLRRHTGRVGTSRFFVPSLWHYCRYVFYRYDIERDAGKAEAATAVVRGVYDAGAGRVGPIQPGPPASGVMRLERLFGAARTIARVIR